MKQFQCATSYINPLVCVCVWGGGYLMRIWTPSRPLCTTSLLLTQGFRWKMSAMLRFWIWDCKIFMFQVDKVILLCLIDNVLKSSKDKSRLTLWNHLHCKIIHSIVKGRQRTKNQNSAKISTSFSQHTRNDWCLCWHLYQLQILLLIVGSSNSKVYIPSSFFLDFGHHKWSKNGNVSCSVSS